MKNKEIMSEEGINAFNKNLIQSLGDYSNNIQKDVIIKEKKDSKRESDYDITFI